MQFKEFDWLSGHGIRAIIPCSTNMTSVRIMFGECFYFNFILAFNHFLFDHFSCILFCFCLLLLLLLLLIFFRGLGVGWVNKTTIPLPLAGYKMGIANSALTSSLAIYHLISNVHSWNNCMPRENFA